MRDYTLINNKIKELRENFLIEFGLKEYSEINNGYCIEFSDDLLNYIEQDLGEDHWFDKDNINGIDIEKVELELGFKLSRNNKEKLKTERIGWHVWVTDEELHFDSECPDGVKCFLELPFFQRELGRIGVSLTDKM